MAIVSFDKNEIIPYVPEFGGNRDSDDPTVVNLKYIGYGKQKKYERIIIQKTAAKAKNVLDDNERAVVITEVSSEVETKQFMECVDSIENYSIIKGGKPVKIVDAKTFHETAQPELIAEIMLAMQSHGRLSEQQRKN